MITRHHRLLAREVIDKSIQLYANGAVLDLPEGRDLVLRDRWPVKGSGGVSHANAQTVKLVRAAIDEFYAPSSNEY